MKTLREFRQALKKARDDRALRQRPSRFGVSLFDGIAQVPATWDEIVPEERLFLRRRYLAALEAGSAGGSGDLCHRYAMLYDGPRPVAVVAAQIFAFSSEAVGSRTAPAEPGLREKVGGALRKATDRVSFRVLVCGNAFVTGEHGFCHVPDLDPEEAIDGLADALYRIRRADKLFGQVAGVLVKDFYEPAARSAARLTRFGYREFAVDPQMVLRLDPSWTSFDDYVAALGKKYRSRVRSALKKGEELERRRFGADEIGRHHDRIRALFLAVHEKATFRIAPLPEGYFAALAEGLGDRFSMWGYFLGEELVGFTSCIQWGPRLEGHYLGLDYEHNVPRAVYQNILYDDVREAIDRGCRELVLGRTALEIKSALGAEPRPVTCYVRHRNPASNRVVKPLFRFIKPTTWTRRNPFG